MRFKIISVPGGYKVSKPNYYGGEVVDAAEYDALAHVSKTTIDILAARNHELHRKLSHTETKLSHETSVQKIRAEKAEARMGGLEKSVDHWVKSFYQLEEKYNAECERKLEAGYQPEYQNRKSSGQTAEASNRDSVQPSREVQKETDQAEVSSNRPFTATANPANSVRFVWHQGIRNYVRAYDPRPFDYQANGGQDGAIGKSKASFAGILSTPRAREVFDNKYARPKDKTPFEGEPLP